MPIESVQLPKLRDYFFSMKQFKFPSPFTVLYIIIIVSAIATWLMPAGSYETLTWESGHAPGGYFKIIRNNGIVENPLATQNLLDSLGLKIDLAKFQEGKVSKPVSIPGTYTEMDESSPQGFWAIITAPIKGVYNTIDIILFVLIIGGFIGVFGHSGAMDQGVGALSRALKGREKWLIVIVTSLMALGATTFGLQEETIAFYPILVPIFMAAGYDLIVPVACVYGGSCVGLMGAMINPFSTIIASDAAGVNWTVGMNSRLAMLVIALVVIILFIIRYAERVKKDPTQSILYGKDIKNPFASKEVVVTSESLSWRTRILLIFFALTFVLMIFGVSNLGWWFEEMMALFLVAAVILGLIQRTGEHAFIQAFISGAKDLLGVSLIIGVARGITIIMDDGQISGTILNEASTLVGGVSGSLFLPILMIVFFVLAFFTSSSSGLAVVSMPIMGALANVVGVPTEEIVNAYLFGFGLMQFITPAGIILPSLSMVNVPFNTWLKFIWPLMLMLGGVGVIVLIAGLAL